MANPDAIEWMRRALADLTARISDLEGESFGLSEAVFAVEVISRPDETEAGAVARLAIGYGNLAAHLVLELAAERDVSPVEMTKVVGHWLNQLEAK